MRSPSFSKFLIIKSQFTNIIFVMDLTKCPICRKQPQEPINLKCTHHPCYDCIQSHVTLDNESKIETKYKVSCPTCKKKTVFYDLRHLIITQTIIDDEDLYVTKKYVNKPIQRKIQLSNCSSLEKAVPNADSCVSSASKRCSITSLANSLQFQLQKSYNSGEVSKQKCPVHGQAFKYYCHQCPERTLLCGQCFKGHKIHRPALLKQSMDKVVQLNQRNKEMLVLKKTDLNTSTDILQKSKNTIFHHYQQVQQQLNDQFSKMYQLLAQQYELFKNKIRGKYDQDMVKISEVNDRINSYRKDVSNLDQLDIRSVEDNVKFINLHETLIKNLKEVKSFTQGGVFEGRNFCLKKNQSAYEIVENQWVWIGEELKSAHPKNSKKSSRKNSNLDEDCPSHRSQKENFRGGGITPTQISLNFRRI